MLVPKLAGLIKADGYIYKANEILQYPYAMHMFKVVSNKELMSDEINTICNEYNHNMYDRQIGEVSTRPELPVGVTMEIDIDSDRLLIKAWEVEEYRIHGGNNHTSRCLSTSNKSWLEAGESL
jgi:hypothetical protein